MFCKTCGVNIVGGECPIGQESEYIPCDPVMRWTCTECRHVWYNDLMTTHLDCPQCGSEEIGHD